MSEKEKPLPRPKASPFGTKKRFEQGEKEPPLVADQMAMAAAEGKLDDFLQQEIPDNEYARKLATMMMGMTGMLSPDRLQPPPEERKEEEQSGTIHEGETPPVTQPPDDVITAVRAGDVEGLMWLLEREHKRRSAGEGTDSSEEQKKDYPLDATDPEKEVIDRLLKIASENDLTMDWVIFRALRLYVREYQRTGRL